MNTIEARRAKERMSAGGGDKKTGVEYLPHPVADCGKSRDLVGKKLGVSGKLIDQAEMVQP